MTEEWRHAYALFVMLHVLFIFMHFRDYVRFSNVRKEPNVSCIQQAKTHNMQLHKV